MSDLIVTKPDFLSKKLKMPYNLRRFDRHESRYYFEIEDRRTTNGDEIIHPYISITSLADKLIPGGKQLDRWRAALGKDAESYMVERAVFGTLFHHLAFLPLTGKSKVHKHGFDFDWLRYRGRGKKHTNFELLIEPEWRWAASKWEWSFTRGLLAWFEFVKETVKDVLAIEVTLRSKDGYAATLDFVHTAEYYGKDHLCITDIKSFLYEAEETKTKSFYDVHEFQLEGCKNIWNENFPELPVTQVYNWSPTQWRKSPGWKWKNQTKNQFADVTVLGDRTYTAFELLVEYAKTKRLNKPPSRIIHVGGKIEDIRSFNWKNHIKELNL